MTKQHGGPKDPDRDIQRQDVGGLGQKGLPHKADQADQQRKPGDGQGDPERPARK
ncbi:MAG TPA: hypothetical protein VNF99_22520 [Stellaceae bacterium]|nr:hypothetical protein [Stellaceae bacterium]